MSKKSAVSKLGATEARLTIPLHVPPARAWDALVGEIATWWPASFYTRPGARFVLEPRLGGMMGEVAAADGEGLVWYRVIGVEKPTSLLLAGYLLPPWAGPATSLLRLTLTADAKDGTVLEIVDSTFGKLGDCDNTEGWRQIFEGGLQAHLARKPARKK